MGEELPARARVPYCLAGAVCSEGASCEPHMALSGGGLLNLRHAGLSTLTPPRNRASGVRVQA